MGYAFIFLTLFPLFFIDGSAVPTAIPIVQPSNSSQVVDAGKDLISALGAHRWWFAAAGGIFILIYVLGALGIWNKIGTRWAWIAVGILSIAAGCFAAFDTQGFNWGAFLGYATAGPTIAWIRDFVKDGIKKRKIPLLFKD